VLAQRQRLLKEGARCSGGFGSCMARFLPVKRRLKQARSSINGRREAVVELGWLFRAGQLLIRRNSARRRRARIFSCSRLFSADTPPHAADFSILRAAFIAALLLPEFH